MFFCLYSISFQRFSLIISSCGRFVLAFSYVLFFPFLSFFYIVLLTASLGLNVYYMNLFICSCSFFIDSMLLLYSTTKQNYSNIDQIDFHRLCLMNPRTIPSKQYLKRNSQQSKSKIYTHELDDDTSSADVKIIEVDKIKEMQMEEVKQKVLEKQKVKVISQLRRRKVNGQSQGYFWAVDRRDLLAGKIELTDKDYHFISRKKDQYVFHEFILLSPQLLRHIFQHLASKNLIKAQKQIVEAQIEHYIENSDECGFIALLKVFKEEQTERFTKFIKSIAFQWYFRFNEPEMFACNNPLAFKDTCEPYSIQGTRQKLKDSKKKISLDKMKLELSKRFKVQRQKQRLVQKEQRQLRKSKQIALKAAMRTLKVLPLFLDDPELLSWKQDCDVLTTKQVERRLTLAVEKLQNWQKEFRNMIRDSQRLDSKNKKTPSLIINLLE